MINKLAKRMESLKPSPTLSLNALAQSMQKQGIDVVNLTAGETDFPTPEAVSAAAIQALRAGKTRYTPAHGIPALRKGVAGWFASRWNLHYSEKQVTVTAGVKQGIFNLALANLDPGDEVVIPAPYWVSYPAIVEVAGAKPVFVASSSRDGFRVDPEKIRRAITPRTKGILPVHLTGRPARMPEILKLAKKHNLFVVEDAAQSVGAKLDNQRIGSWGKAACFSLHPLKNLHAFGDGGMVTTSDTALYEQLLKARNHGLRNRQDCDFWSSNSRLDEVQAALLSVQLAHLDARTEERRKLAARYNQRLKAFVGVPEEGAGEFCVYQTYMIQADRRDELKDYLNERGVQASVHYPTPIPLQPAAKKLGYRPEDFPVTMKIVSRILSLPLYPGMTREQQDRVVDLIKEFYAR